MRSIDSSEVCSFDKDGAIIHQVSCEIIRRHPGIVVNNVFDLYSKIAELQYSNPWCMLLFRGQAKDYRNKRGETTIPPSIFRYNSDSMWASELLERMKKLKSMEEQVANVVKNLGDKKYLEMINKVRVFRWAIIQHYNLCETPLLDVTQSLRVAASFACSLQDDNSEGFLYAIAVPSMAGSITADIDSGIQIVRLLSACHPTALRPHIQEGYLVGEFPDIDSIEQKMQYSLDDVDLGKRVLAKFRINKKMFRGGDFPLIKKHTLYPGEEDKFFNLTKNIRSSWSPC